MDEAQARYLEINVGFKKNKALSDIKRAKAGWKKTGDEWTHKPCNHCLEVLPIEKFYLGKYKSYSISAKCKDCHPKKSKLE